MIDMPITAEEEPRVITNFEHHHAAHCESGATAGLCRYQGIEDVTEPLAFGIGGGVFFGYFPFLRAAHIRVTTYRRTPGGILCNAFRRLGIRYYRKNFWSKAKAARAVDEVLDQGTPVMCQVSLYWLPYFAPSMRIHFNAHHIVVYGREDGHYVISEPMLEEPVTLTRDELTRARFARGGMNPNGRMYWLRDDPQPRSVNLSRPILQGIQDVCYHMLVPPVPLLGIRGIRFLARDVLRWKRKLPDDVVRENLSQIVYMQELVGSGGAGYRAMYAAFLTEAADVMKSEELADAGRKMTAIADQWRDFAVLATRFVRRRPNPGDTYSSMANALQSLAAQEETLYRDLREYAKRTEASL
jgi:hypothetical protein